MSLFTDQYESEGLSFKKEKGKFRCVLCENDVEKIYEMPFKVDEKTLTKIYSRYPELNILNITHSTDMAPEVDVIGMRKIKGKAYEINVPHCKSCMHKIRQRHMYKVKNLIATKQI